MNKIYLKTKTAVFQFCRVLSLSKAGGSRERSGSVVECLTRDLRAAGSSLTGVTVLCP